MTNQDEEAETPFLQSANFLRTWARCTAQRCDIEGVALSLDRAPPLALQAAPPSVSPAPPQQVTKPVSKKAASDPYVNTVLAIAKVSSSIGGAMHVIRNPTPAPAKTFSVAATPPPPKRPTVPPFDIQDIPGAMRKLGMPMSAKLMERWFSGQLNYSKNDADEKAELDQNGAPYPPSMSDTTSITMAWVLRFRRARTTSIR